MVLRALRILPLVLVVCCWSRLNAAVPLSVHLRTPRQAPAVISEEKENVQEVGKDVVLRIRARRDAGPMDLSFRRHHDDDEIDEERTHERRHHRRPRKKIMIKNENTNVQIHKNEEEVERTHRRQDHRNLPKETVSEDTTAPGGMSFIPILHSPAEQNCAGGKKENERYSSSFAGNVSSTRRLNLETDFDEVAKEHAGKKTSDVYMGEDITLCWIETTTVKEDQSFSPPKRVVIREYTISFENAATIPDRYLDCSRLPGEVGSRDPDVGKTALFEVIDENTRVSKLVNFTAVSHVGDVLVWQHKRVKCGVGPVVTKHVVEWNDGGQTPKKRVEIKVSPKMHQLSVSSPGDPCETESPLVGTSTVSTLNYSKEEVSTEIPGTELPPAPDSTEAVPVTGPSPVVLPVSTETVPEESTEGQVDQSTVEPGEAVTELPVGEVTVTTECTPSFTTLPPVSTTGGLGETSTSVSTELGETSTEGGEVSSTISTEVPLAEVTESYTTESTTGATESVEETSTAVTESSEESTTSATELAEESTTSGTEWLEESTASVTELAGMATIYPTESPEESTTSSTEFGEASTIGESSSEAVSVTTEGLATSTTESWETSSVVPAEGPSTESSTIFPTESTVSSETEETSTFGLSTEPSESSTVPGEITSTESSEYQETTTESEEICPDDSSESCLVDSQETSTSSELSTTESVESTTTESATTESEGGESTEESASESPESTTTSAEESGSESVSESSTEGAETTTEPIDELAYTQPPDITISGGLNGSVSLTGNRGGDRTLGDMTTDLPEGTTASLDSCEGDSGCACNRDGSCSQPPSEKTLSTIIGTLTDSLGMRKKTTAVPDSLKSIFSKSSDQTGQPGMTVRLSTVPVKDIPTETLSLDMTTPTVPCDESLGSCSQKGSSESCDGSENCSPTDSTEPCDSSISGSCSEETDASIQGTTPNYGDIVFPATTIPVSRESYNVSSSIDNVPTTVETRRSTPLSAISTSSPDHKLVLKIRVLLEHTNENQEKQNLVEVEKHLLLNENPKDTGHADLLEQIRSLNKSVNMQAIKALLNCTSLGQLAEDTNQLVSSQLDTHVKPSGLHPSVYPSLAAHTVVGNSDPAVNDFYHKPSIHSRHQDSDYDDTRKRKRRQINTRDEENLRTKIRKRRHAQDREENFGFPKIRKNRIAEPRNASGNARDRSDTSNVPQIQPLLKEENDLSLKNASKEKNGDGDSAANFQITDSSEIDAIKESLPGMQEDVMAGLQHVLSELSAKDLQPAEEKVADNLSKSKLLDVVADPQDKRIHQRQRRSTVEEVGRWSNERIRKVPSGDQLRSFTEFTIYKDHS